MRPYYSHVVEKKVKVVQKRHCISKTVLGLKSHIESPRFGFE